MIKRQTCPICNSEIPIEPGKVSETFPFCNERCRNIDLLRWSKGKYAIVEELDPELAQFLHEDQEFDDIDDQ